MTPRLITCSVCAKRGHSSALCPDYVKRALHYLARLDRELDPEHLSPWVIDQAPDEWPEMRRLAKLALAVVERGTDLQHAMRLLDGVINGWPKFKHDDLEGMLVARSYRKHAVKAQRAVQLEISRRRNE